MTDEERKYIHGTTPTEQHRLSTLNDLLNQRSLAAMEIEPGIRLLDVGAGLGQLTRALARAAGPDGTVVGLERDAVQLSEAQRKAEAAGESGLVEFREGNAYDFPLAAAEWSTFDIVHTRFVLEHVTDPDAVVRNMFRAARPGGRIILEDDDHDVLRIWPRVEGFENVWRHYIKTFSALGYDPYIGRRFVSLLREAGAVSVRNDWKFFGGCYGNPVFEQLVTNFIGVIAGAREAMLENTSIAAAEIDRTLEDLRQWGQREDASLWYCTFWAEGQKALAS